MWAQRPVSGLRIDGRLLRIRGHDMTESYVAHEPGVLLVIRRKSFVLFKSNAFCHSHSGAEMLSSCHPR